MDHDLQPASYAVANILFVFGTISILLRCYSRASIVRQFGWDDWIMAAILVFNAGQQVILMLFLEFGAGFILPPTISSKIVPNRSICYTRFQFHLLFGIQQSRGNVFLRCSYTFFQHRLCDNLHPTDPHLDEFADESSAKAGSPGNYEFRWNALWAQGLGFKVFWGSSRSRDRDTTKGQTSNNFELSRGNNLQQRRKEPGVDTELGLRDDSSQEELCAISTSSGERNGIQATIDVRVESNRGTSSASEEMIMEKRAYYDVGRDVHAK
ncbi:hypothetical protein K440DRAFT_657352 [Wilcoxina mikolae CBS 423.85]|nr:hypothetical protein K440DRAFT_657352 [Wilcoxina mikolae CBS 423.85]